MNYKNISETFIFISAVFLLCFYILFSSISFLLIWFWKYHWNIFSQILQIFQTLIKLNFHFIVIPYIYFIPYYLFFVAFRIYLPAGTCLFNFLIFKLQYFVSYHFLRTNIFVPHCIRFWISSPLPFLAYFLKIIPDFFLSFFNVFLHYFFCLLPRSSSFYSKYITFNSVTPHYNVSNRFLFLL